MSKGGDSGNQTVTQQNIPDWAMGFGRQTLDIGDQYTMNPNYRAGSLDRDYSGLRGYDAQGQPNSQVGQSGLNPRRQALPGTNLDGTDQYRPNNINNLVAQLPPDMQGGGQNLGRRPGTGLKFADEMPVQRNMQGGGRSAAKPKNYLQNTVPDGTQPGNVNPDGTPVEGGKKTDKPDYVPTTYVDETGEYTAEDRLTPFQAFDRQRFAAPGQNTVRGEGILAGRYDQRFGSGGTDPFAAANQAVGTAANYTSGFQGTMGEGGLGGQAGNYQQGLSSATDPNVFQAGNYTSGLPNFANPNANQTNVNSAVGNVNARLQANTFSNANAGLTGAQNYNRNFQNLVNQSNNPYQDQVVNQTISDLNRARQLTQNEIGGQAAKSGAFGGSRQALLEAENNRNYLDRVAAATGQLRQQGFESAANRAQQENLQRLGLTASDTQNVRGLQSQGNLAAQGLTARDTQDVRGLQSQGALTAQGLQSQGGLAAQGLQSQGALAALKPTQDSTSLPSV
jgi:hypothetical protein